MGLDAVALGHVVLDDIHRPDGTSVVGLLGGAGTYAALGQAMISERTALVSGIGTDFPAGAIELFRAASVETSALAVMDPHTPRTIVRYLPDGERTETSAHGAAHFSRLDPTWDMLGTELRAAAGFYVFDGINAPLWDHLAEARHTTGCQILWEIRADICTPEHFAAVTAQLNAVDILSINRAEIRGLCAEDDLVECLDRVAATGVPVIALRLGPRGALVRTADRVLIAQPPSGAAVDPTGGGNSFSGGFLAEWVVSGGDDERALRSAMAAAELTIRQAGPPTVTAATRLIHRTIADSIHVTRTSAANLRENGTLL